MKCHFHYQHFSLASARNFDHSWGPDTEESIQEKCWSGTLVSQRHGFLSDTAGKAPQLPDTISQVCWMISVNRAFRFPEDISRYLICQCHWHPWDSCGWHSIVETLLIWNGSCVLPTSIMWMSEMPLGISDVSRCLLLGKQMHSKLGIYCKVGWIKIWAPLTWSPVAVVETQTSNLHRSNWTCVS